MAYDVDINKELINAEDMDTPNLDGAQILNADVVNQTVAGTGNDAAINSDQINNGVDNDSLYDPNVSYQGGDGGWAYKSGGGDFDLKSNASAGFATTSGNEAYVGDDGSISGAANATSAAAAADRGFAQSLSTGANTQSNSAKVDFAGGDSSGSGGGNNTPANYSDAIDIDNELVDAYDADIQDLDGLQFMNAAVVNQNASGPGNDTAINLGQNNNLVDNDLVDNPDVSYSGGNGGNDWSDGGNHTLRADANAAGASATGNLARIQTGDGTISNAANATASASASVDAFTQDIATGGNLQVNSATLMIDGGTSEGQEGPAGQKRDHVSVDGDNYNSDSVLSATYVDIGELDGVHALNADIVNQNASGSGNDNAINVDQINNLVDRDKVVDPNVRYNGGNAGNGGNGADFNLTAVASAGAATATNNDATVADDGSISGAASAESIAVASAEAFTQEISTGGNTQANQLKASIEGGVVNPATGDPDDDHGYDNKTSCDDGCGGDDDHHHPKPGDCGPDVCDDQTANYHDPAIQLDAELIDASNLEVCDLDGLQFLNADLVNQDVSGSGNDTAFNVDQINNLVDNDQVWCPDVTYCGGNGSDCDSYSTGGDFTLYAQATSGAANAGGNYASVGDDGSISDAGNAVSSASASAEAFSQTIVMGANVQFNSMDLNIVGDTDS